MLASIIALRGIVREKAGKDVLSNKPDQFKELKATFNIVGVFVLIMCFYFGFMILMMGLPKIFSFVSSDEQTETAKLIDTKALVQLDEYNSNTELAYIAVISFYSKNEIDVHLEEVLKSAMKVNEYKLIPNIVSNFYNKNKLDEAASLAVKYLCDKGEYKYAIEVALLHFNKNMKDEDLSYIIDKLNVAQNSKDLTP